MSHHTQRPLTLRAALIPLLLVGVFAPPAPAATASDESKPVPEQQPAKPMVKKEPMAGEMKKDTMKKGDVKKAAEKKAREMKDVMDKESKSMPRKENQK